MYQAAFTKQASSNLAEFDKQLAQRILKKLRWLCERLEQITPEPLSYEWQGYYKLRIGDYRLIYHIEVETSHIIVHFVGHRRNIYKV